MSDKTEKFKEQLGEQMERMTGGRLTKDMVSETFDQAKANMDTLNACKGPHEFERIEEDGVRRTGFCCKICGGIVNATSAMWYRKGLQHAGKGPTF
jgi:hypothetical protein